MESIDRYKVIKKIHMKAGRKFISLVTFEDRETNKKCISVFVCKKISDIIISETQVPGIHTTDHSEKTMISFWSALGYKILPEQEE